MEAVTATRNQLRGEIQELRVELSQRIDVLALAVRQNSDDIRQNSEEIRQLKTDVQELKADVCQNNEDIRQLKGDVQQLKADVRLNTEAIRQSAEEIRSMRELLERKADHETLLKLQARVEVVERRLGIQ